MNNNSNYRGSDIYFKKVGSHKCACFVHCVTLITQSKFYRISYVDGLSQTAPKTKSLLTSGANMYYSRKLLCTVYVVCRYKDCFSLGVNYCRSIVLVDIQYVCATRYTYMLY